YKFAEFRRLDIERSPEEQGFESGGFDVVVATNVLHATSDLENTLRNVKLLLRKGGFLVLNELVQVDLFHSLTFGLLDGWWKCEDKRQAGGPLLDEASWRELLGRVGFRGVCVPGKQDRWKELPA